MHVRPIFVQSRGCDSATRQHRANVTAPVYDPRMGALGWIAVAVATGLALAVVGLWRSGKRRRAALDVGSVSEGWLAEQRGRKDS